MPIFVNVQFSAIGGQGAKTPSTRRPLWRPNDHDPSHGANFFFTLGHHIINI